MSSFDGDEVVVKGGSQGARDARDAMHYRNEPASIDLSRRSGSDDTKAPSSVAIHASSGGEAPPTYAAAAASPAASAAPPPSYADTVTGAPTVKTSVAVDIIVPPTKHKHDDDGVELVDAGASPVAAKKPWAAQGSAHTGSSASSTPARSSAAASSSASSPPPLNRPMTRLQSTFRGVTGRDTRAKCEISKEAIFAFWFFYLSHAFVLGCYFGFVYAVKTTLWLAGGMAFFFAIACVCCCVIGSKQLDAAGMFVLLVVFVSATFAGLLGGHYFQTYWYYSDITVYDGVDTRNAASLSGSAKYNFVAGTTIGQQYGGYVAYQTTNNYYTTDHQVCVAPIVPPGVASDTATLDVRFWVVGIDCCGSSATVSACGPANGWNDPTLFAVTIRGGIEKSGDAIATAVSLYRFNTTGVLPQDQQMRFTSTDAVYVKWTTEAAFEEEQKNNLTYGRVIISIHLVLWPLWALPVACFLICGKIFR